MHTKRVIHTGASLSEPHTSMMHVCIYLCMFACLHNVRTHSNMWRQVEGYCQSVASATWSKDDWSWSTHGINYLQTLCTMPEITSRKGLVQTKLPRFCSHRSEIYITCKVVIAYPSIAEGKQKVGSTRLVPSLPTHVPKPKVIWWFVLVFSEV